MNYTALHTLFNPKSIAVIGASDKVGSIGYSLMQNLVEGKFDGNVYPVNVKQEIIFGRPTVPDVSAIADTVDVAIIATPAVTVPAIVESCGKKGVKGVVIISSGFMETDAKGKLLHHQIQASVKKYGLSVLGPNCLGFINPAQHLNASFAPNDILPGNVAFISQSGALGSAILDWAYKHQMGFRYFVSIGEMMDIGYHDLIDYFGQDPHVSSILIYMESLSQARQFMSAARSVSRIKPIIILKVGKSKEGAKAAQSHTGSIAGNDQVFSAAFKRAGIVRVNTVQELFDCAKALALQPRPVNKRLAIVTNAGGPGVIATDALIELGGQLATLSAKSMQILNQSLSANWSHNNPVDLLGDANALLYKTGVETCLGDPNVDAVLAMVTPQAMTDVDEIAETLGQLHRSSNKPLIAVIMGGNAVTNAKEILEKAKIPVYPMPEEAIETFMNLYQYSEHLESLYETPTTIPRAFKPDVQQAQTIITNVLNEKRTILTQPEIRELFSCYQIPVVESTLATSLSDVKKALQNIAFPVVMKLISKNFLHKTDVNGVRLNIKSVEKAQETYQDLIDTAMEKDPKAKIDGILIQKMVEVKHELLIGCARDPLFGPTIVFGMGGIAVEVFKDTNIELPPITMTLARKLIEGTKIFRLLKGYRGLPGVDLNALEFVLYKFAYLVMDIPEIQEIDINPFAIGHHGGIVLDSRIILQSETQQSLPPYSHLVISPYPKEYEKTIKMKNGTPVLLRPIRPEDEQLENELFDTFSEETRRLRFFSRKKQLGHEMMTRFTQIDYDREIGIVAEYTDQGVKKFMADGRLLYTDPYLHSAELAVVVGDPWQHTGLGTVMLQYMISLARKRGIKTVVSHVLAENSSVIRMLKNEGFTIRTSELIVKATLHLS